MHLSVNRLVLLLLLVLLAAVILQGCSNAPRQQTSAPASAGYCIGRVAVTPQVPLQFLGGAYQFYWGDIDTWREDEASYRRRVQAAQAPVDGARVRQLLKPVATLPDNHGLLIVAREEDRQPFDPNVVQVTGFIHRDGTTLRFQKRAVSRLQDVTEQRAREILAASEVSATPFPPATQAQEGLCIMHGMVKLAPLPGWHEATRTEGKFMLEGVPYRFSLRTRYLRSLSLNALEKDNQRLVLAELAGGTKDSTVSEQALSNTSSLLTINTPSGGKRIAEWRLPASGTSHATPVTFLYVWPESGNLSAKQDAAFMQWLVSHPQQSTPLLQLRSVQAAATQTQPAPVREESKVVYRMQLAYPGDQDAGNRRYIILRDNQQVDEGRSDAQGFTRAHNADYDETWGTTVMNK
ncbi:hypothetical protein [Janthinobacterium psychrotolerans]|uniref:Tle cognate immunity protein 4 C-terminal domain-containing protein n=1 Tax=Janthinobacterium psychrotolerans TaxID=1747903 RepID=A0A1A7C622_9BURK|nr:hypothetical protein [Janthinobacterium psychrotolerans]OBV39763.1 hypothetical protein ASR47_1011155 [Janthinobacterium psychrotolerans]